MGGSNPETAFSVPYSQIDPMCDMQLKKNELTLCCMEADALKSGDLVEGMAFDNLEQNYPQLAPSLLSLLHTVSDNMEGKKNGL